MRTVLSVLLTISAISAVPVDYIAPVASGYIYRSDNNGPASLIQLGAVPYQHPLAFDPTLQLAQPLKLEAAEGYNLEPQPLPYVAIKEIPVEEEDNDSDDDSDESSEEYLGDDGHGFENAAGNDYGEEHFHASGEKGSEGYNTGKHHQDGENGHYGDEHHEGHYSEGEGEKASHFDEGDAYGKHHEAGDSYEGGDHGHKKYSSKGEDITGFHKIYNKEEFKKDHDFYDVADNSGHFKKHGFENEHYGSEKGKHEKGGHQDSAFEKGGFGKGGFHAVGDNDEHADSHSNEEGHDSHYKHHEDFGKKGGSGYEKAYSVGDDEDEY